MSGGGILHPLINTAMLAGIINAGAGISLADNKFSVFDPADPTKIARFDAGLISAGTTRVIGLPNADTTLGGLSVAQTWSADQTFSGQIIVSDTTDAVSAITGSITTAGGLSYGAAKTMYGGLANFAGDVTASANLTVGATSGDTFTVRIHGAGGTNLVGIGGGAIARLAGYTAGFAAPADLYLNPSGGTVVVPLVDINGGAIDGTAIGASSTSTGAFTTVTASSTLTAEGTINANGGTLQLNAKSFANVTGGNTFNIGAISNSSVQTLTFYTNDGSNIATLRGQFDVNGQLSLVATTDSTSTTTGSFTTLGGISYGAAKTMYGGLANFAGAVTCAALAVASDTDAATTLGRASVGYYGSADVAGFAHIDHFTSSGVALVQTSAGTTYVNAPSGQSVILAINGTTVGTVAAAGLSIASGLALQLGNTAVAETPTATHTLIFKDLAGATYRVLCVP